MNATIFRLLWILAVLVAVSSSSHATETPNVVFVLADDLGYGDHGVHGHPRVKTPNIDQLSVESVRFTDYHVAPVCTPTRSELMTGVSAYRNGGSGTLNGHTTVRLDLPMMPQFFKDNGYATAHFGKWHLGDNYPYRPHDRGFDVSYRYNSFGLHSIAGHWENAAFDDLGWYNDKPARFKGYNTDFFFSEAMSWMRQQTKPFFVYLAPTAPHAPLYVESRYEKPYEDLGKLLAAYFGMTAYLDENVGRLKKFLDESGLARNTIFIYMTDNGSREHSQFYNAGMRGTKGSLYDGGHRVPFFIRWPAGLQGEPRDIKALAHGTDILPTLLDLTGLKIGRPAGFDGHSLKPLLENGADPFPDRKVVIQYGEEFKKWDCAVLWNKWRLVNGKELYDITSDPRQKKDLAPQREDVVRAMREYYEQWVATTTSLLNPENYIGVGTTVEPVTDLTAEGWFGPRTSDWKRMTQINEALFGYWKIEVVATGNHDILLYMFPPDANTPLNQSPRNVPARPVSGARLLVDGKEYRTIQTDASATHARFTIPLKQGERHRIEGQFLDAAGKPIVGAFFTRVTRTPD